MFKYLWHFKIGNILKVGIEHFPVLSIGRDSPYFILIVLLQTEWKSGCCDVGLKEVWVASSWQLVLSGTFLRKQILNVISISQVYL